MKTLDEIKREYKEYVEREHIPAGTDELMAYIMDVKGNPSEEIEDIQKEEKHNKREKLLAKGLNTVLSFMGEEDLSYYDEDLQILQEEFVLCLGWRVYFEEIEKVLTSENVRECIRLALFTNDFFRENANYLEAERDSLELAHKGIVSFSEKYHDSRESFPLFFMERIQQLSEKKAIQKVKEL